MNQTRNAKLSDTRSGDISFSGARTSLPPGPKIHFEDEAADVGKKNQNPGVRAAGMGDRPTHIQSLAAVKVKRCGMCTHISHGLTLTGRTSHEHFAFADARRLDDGRKSASASNIWHKQCGESHD